MTAKRYVWWLDPSVPARAAAHFADDAERAAFVEWFGRRLADYRNADEIATIYTAQALADERRRAQAAAKAARTLADWIQGQHPMTRYLRREAAQGFHNAEYAWDALERRLTCDLEVCATVAATTAAAYPQAPRTGRPPATRRDMLLRDLTAWLHERGRTKAAARESACAVLVVCGYSEAPTTERAIRRATTRAK